MKALHLTLLAGILFSVSGAHAGIVVGGTRLVYDGTKKESSLSVNNPDKSPFLIQSWIDPQSGTGTKAPFIITPPLFRLDGEQQNVLRVVRAGNLPEDRESLYWLNVKAIPSGRKEGNTLQIAANTQIKLIYRPSALKDSTPEQQTDKLIWSRVGNQLQVKNPTAYYMNFNEISIDGKKLSHVTYVAPQSTATFSSGLSEGNSVNWKIISDYGAVGPEHKFHL